MFIKLSKFMKYVHELGWTSYMGSRIFHESPLNRMPFVCFDKQVCGEKIQKKNVYFHSH